MTSARAHLLSGQSGKVDMCPLLFNSFTVCPPNPFCKVEGVLRLTGSTMTRKVKFRDQIGEPEVVGIEVWVVLGQTFKEVN